jgi:hypothetical protein
MGITHKLFPKIKTFIVEQKKKDANLSCRKLSLLITKKFKINISKSSINSLIKQAGLSSSIGRRRKRRKQLREAEGLGTILLKGIDSLFMGSITLNKVIQAKFPKIEDACLLEGLLYLPLFKQASQEALPQNSGLWPLIGKNYNYQTLISYLNDLQGVTTLAADILKVISDLSQDVWFITLTLIDNSVLYLDGQLRTVWSTPRIPHDFSSTLYKLKSYIENYFKGNSPFILFTAPGYNLPTREFFDFLFTLEAERNTITKITLYGNKMELLEAIPVYGFRKKQYILGLWPWQFEKYRELNIFSEFSSFYFEPLQENFYIAEARIYLTQPKINQRVTLRTCVLKKNLAGKVDLFIVSNITQEQLSTEDVVRLYLSHWPNLEEGFLDFSRKIELFTYTASASSRKEVSMEIEDKERPDIKTILEGYLRGLDLYLRWHILPSKYEELDFPTTKERFYGLKARIKTKKEYHLVSFILPRGYLFQKDLAYACQRFNEREIILPDKKQLWFNIC